MTVEQQVQHCDETDPFQCRKRCFLPRQRDDPVIGPLLLR